ncbi:nicotinamidase isoform X2 [Procambarus clarkii]|uniref:nicotinamidase isoform X2 n=1 Tax=Procambarus clarkii TaxID=6728 RepID=UPI0037439DA6
MSEGEQGVWGDQEAAFKHFDKDQDGFLNKNEFSALCCALFQNEKGETYPIETTIFDAIFTIFDNKKDQVIDSDEFHYCWQQWITTVLRPVTALVVVDVQNDFISGSLGLNINLEDQHGEKITSAEAQVYDTVIFDMLEDGEPMVQKLWPRHSVQNTWGSKLHQDLKVPEDAVFVYKGTDPDVDSYSAFWDNIKKSQSSLNEELQKRSVTDLFLCGIGYDVCVAATTRHAIEEGYRAVLVDNATRGVCDSDIQATKDHTIANNGLIVHSSQVKGLATGRDRHPVLAYKLALDLSKKMNKK